MRKIRFTFFILLFSSSFINVFGQEIIVSITSREVEYFIDTTKYFLITVEYKNITNENIILWLNKNQTVNLKLDQKIRRYFYTVKGDFSIAQLLNENIANGIPVILYTSFVKMLKPSNSFSFQLLTNSNNCGNLKIKLTDYLNERVVSCKETTLKNYIDIVKLTNYYYKDHGILLNINDVEQ